MRMISTRQAALATACLIPLATAADDEPTLQLNPLVVTPTLSTQTVDESLSSVTVIDRETLDQQQPRELSDVLRGQPGIDISTTGSFGKGTSIYTRGTGAESTVLLIDGIRIRSATNGNPPWQFIPPQLVDQIEVVRGPRASLYGADATGGVIQAFTPDGRDRDTAWIQGGAGSFGSHEYGAGFSGSAGNTAYSLGLNHFHTDGVEVREGGDDRGFRNTSGLARLSHRFDGGIELGLTGFRAHGRTAFDGGRTDFVKQAAGTELTVPVSPVWLTSVQFSEARDEEEQVDDDSVFDTRTRTARIENHHAAGPHDVVFGAEFVRDEVDGSTDYDEDGRDNRAVFGQTVFVLDDADLQLSLRWDDNEAFGDRATGAAAIGVRLDNAHRVRLSYGTAFRAPTFNDLYFPGFGNPDLSPERSQTAELGFRGQYRTGYWDVALFETHVDDLIQFDAATFSPQNVARARIQGLEVAAGRRLGSVEINAAATLMDPRDRETGNRLARRARQSARLDVDRQMGAVSLGVTGLVQGDRYNAAENEERLSGFGLVNLRAGWKFARNWSARLTVDNVLDKDYVTARNSSDEFDYKNAGRSAFLSVRYGNR
ncbi:TonB-dependent receptor domain-containing protein [Aquisalimonas sp. 2447]|uniref:TonB-dependent receptor domain-containing protein n=1 Tax=Aquisalimonas sp. 2447 TaxID=2740807 RepID=UPI001C2C1FDD|nr:TonB-dependent receptor [Aquisalimonas sp. 2447]